MGQLSNDPTRALQVPGRSYRYVPGRDAWVCTGDLPEQQQFVSPTVGLPHDQLLAAGGSGIEFLTSPALSSVRAFVYRPDQPALVAEMSIPRRGSSLGDASRSGAPGRIPARRMAPCPT